MTYMLLGSKRIQKKLDIDQHLHIIIFLLDFKIIHNDDNKIQNRLKQIALKDPTEIQNRHCASDMKTNQNPKNHHEIESIIRRSNDSLELYFNNFFRDKYFSKLALSEKKSSSRSLRPRKKKSEYHCSRSHSQTCINESKLNMRCASTNFGDQTEDSEQIDTSESENLSENHFSGHGNIEVSLSLMYHLTKMFCEYWITHKFAKDKDMTRSLTRVKNVFSEDRSDDEAIRKLFCHIKQKILQGWYVFYFYFLIFLMFALTETCMA